MTISVAVFDNAVQVLRQGGVVAFPTETYYGLAVDPFNQDALSRLFAVKKRAISKPVLTLINNREHLQLLVIDISPVFTLLMDQFWPGPLTLVFSAQQSLPALLTGNTDTVGVRQSSHPVANMLADAFGGPITATSANISGQEPAVAATEIKKFFRKGVDAIINGGKTPGGKGSTIIGIRQNRLQCLRDGVVPYTKIIAAVSASADSHILPD